MPKPRRQGLSPLSMIPSLAARMISASIVFIAQEPLSYILSGGVFIKDSDFVFDLF